MFKLTVFALAKDESPDIPYGDRPGDSYQDTEGIRRSSRRIPADLPKSRIVSSSFDRLDPKKQLREAGYPFDHIGTELMTLHGKFEVVSVDVRMMRDEFQRRTDEVSSKIQTETNTLSAKIEETRKNLLVTVESLFDRKFIRVAGVIIGAIPVMYGGVAFLQDSGLAGRPVAFITVIAGVAVLFLTYVLTRRGT